MLARRLALVRRALHMQAVVLLLRCAPSRALFNWNWVLTNPHDVNLADLDVMRDAPLGLSADDADGSSADTGLPSTCERHVQCPLDRFCDDHYGVCRLLRPVGAACRRDSHCATGLDCTFGRCEPIVPRGLPGARCGVDKDCQPGLCCARRHGQRVCKARLRLGQRCYVPDGGLVYFLNEMCPCDDGLVCASVRPRNATT